MNKLEELILKYCPEGVKRVKLGEVCQIVRGNSLSKADIGLGDTPIILYGELYTTYGHRIQKVVSMTSMDIARKATLIQKGDILLPLSSTTKEAQIGKASVYDAENDAYLGGDAMILRNSQNSYYLAYYINSTLFEKEKMRCVQGTTIMHLHPSELMKISIPLPPLPVQEEIVRMLDAMSELQENLEKELEERRKQFAYCRDKLMTFNDLTTPPSQRVEWKQLGEVFELRNGYTPSKNNNDFWENGTIPWFRMEDIREKGRILSDSIQHITPKAIKGKGLFEANTFILATTATIGEHALLLADSLANQRFTNLKIRKSLKDSLLTKFMFYFMFNVDSFCKEHINKSGFASVDMEALRKMPIPLPPLAVQEEITEKLDKMEELINNIESELTERKRQYEHYREQLLSSL